MPNEKLADRIMLAMMIVVENSPGMAPPELWMRLRDAVEVTLDEHRPVAVGAAK